MAALCSVVHSACHIARFAYEGNAVLMMKGEIPRSGLVALLLLVVLAVPMSIGFLREKVGGFPRPPLPFLLSCVPLLACVGNYHAGLLCSINGVVFAATAEESALFVSLIPRRIVVLDERGGVCCNGGRVSSFRLSNTTQDCCAR